MKRLMMAIIATIILIGSLSPVANANGGAALVPLPRPNPLAAIASREDVLHFLNTERERIRTAQVQDPQFRFPDRTTPPNVAPVVPATPVVVNAAPVPVVLAGGPDFHAWTSNGLQGLIAALLAWIGTRLHGKSGSPVTGTKLDGSKVSDIVNAVLHPAGTSIIGDPALRQTVDAALIAAIESGVPGGALRSGLGLIPGAAPFVNMGEPLLRRAALKFLNDRMGGAVPPAVVAALDGSPPPAIDAQRFDALESIIKGIAQKLGSHDQPKAA